MVITISLVASLYLFVFWLVVLICLNSQIVQSFIDFGRLQAASYRGWCFIACVQARTGLVSFWSPAGSLRQDWC